MLARLIDSLIENFLRVPVFDFYMAMRPCIRCQSNPIPIKNKSLFILIKDMMMRQYFFVAALLISAIILPQQALGASLKKTTVKTGDCSQVAKNDVRVHVHYTGTLEDGTKYAERRRCL